MDKQTDVDKQLTKTNRRVHKKTLTDSQSYRRIARLSWTANNLSKAAHKQQLSQHLTSLKQHSSSLLDGKNNSITPHKHQLSQHLASLKHRPHVGNITSNLIGYRRHHKNKPLVHPKISPNSDVPRRNKQMDIALGRNSCTTATAGSLLWWPLAQLHAPVGG